MSLLPVSQVVKVNGAVYYAHAVAIDQTLDQTSRAQFTADVDANAGRAPIREGDWVEIIQTADGTQTFVGRVTQAAAQRGDNYTRWAVIATDLADLAVNVRFLRAFGPQMCGEMIRSAWNEYAPGHVTLDIPSWTPTIDEYTSTYQSLADLMNYCTSTTGWAWKMEGRTLRFFDPTQNARPGLVQSDFHKGTLEARRSLDGMVNVARQQAYQYIYLDFNRFHGSDTTPAGRWTWTPPCADALMTGYGEGVSLQNFDGVPLSEWEFVDYEIRSVVLAVDTDEELEFEWEPDNYTLKSNIQLAKIGSPSVVARFRRLIWVEASKQWSINVWGRRDAPTLSNDGGMGIDESLRRLNEYLDLRCEPGLEVSGNALATDILPGDMRRFTFPDLGIDADFVIESVSRRMSGDDLQMSITARSVATRGASAGAAATPVRRAKSRPDPLPEIFRRIDRVENIGLDPRTIAGATWVDKGPVTERPRAIGSWDWVGAFVVKAPPGGEFVIGDEMVIDVPIGPGAFSIGDDMVGAF